MKDSISIIIPTYNHLNDLLKPCIESIQKYTNLTDVEIIVVANGCSDGTEEYVRSLGSPFRLLSFPTAIGYPAAINEGLAIARNTYVVLLNDDVVLLDQPKDQWLDMLVAPFTFTKAGITGPVKFSWDCTGVNRSAMAFWCVMMPRVLFNELGFLDEIFSPGMGEDGDFSIKAECAGYKLIQVPNGNGEEFGKGVANNFPIYHKGSGTFGTKDHSDVVVRNKKILEERYGRKNVLATVVIPTCGKDWHTVLKPCIEAVLRYTEISDKEILVVANGAPDDAILWLKSQPVLRIESPTPLGYVGAVNKGIAAAHGKYVITLDDDSILQEQGKDYWFNLLRGPFQKDDKTAASSPFSQKYDDLGLILHSGCTMYSVEALKQVGLFDEAFNPGYMSDEDLSLRLVKAGYKISSVPENLNKTMINGVFGINFPVVHMGTVNTMPKYTTDLPLVERNRKLLYERHSKKQMKASIILPTYNHLEDLLKPNIASLQKYTDLSNIEVIIIANGCTDGTEDWVKTLGDGFKLLSFPEPIGYTKATNEGIKIATGKYLIFYNNDNELLPQPKDQWINWLIEPFEKDPMMGITGPLQLHDDYAGEDAIIGFCLCVSREVMNKVMVSTNGLLDEIFSPGGGEDIDLCCKVRAAGYTVRQVPKEGKLGFSHTNTGQFLIWHKNNQTFKDIPQYTKYYVKRNGFYNCKRYNKHIRLNLGSGGVEYMGFLSVDLLDNRAAILMDATKLDFEENSVEEMLVLHLFEHLNPYKALDILKDWYRILKPGGKLIMEMPDIEGLCKKFMASNTGDRYGVLNAIYGSVNTTSEGTPADITSPHLFGWWPQSIADHLWNAGFRTINFGPEQYPHPEVNMHVEAIK